MRCDGPWRRSYQPSADRLDKCDEAAERGFAAHEAPWEAANRHALVENAIDLPAGVFDMDDLVREQVVVHDLNVIVRPDLLERPPERSSAFLSVIRPHLTNDRVHRVIRAACVYGKPANPARLDPVGKRARRARVLDEIARLIRLDRPAVSRPVGRVEAVVASVDDEDVAAVDGDVGFLV